MNTGTAQAATAGRLKLAMTALTRRLRKDWPDELTPSRVTALATVAAGEPLAVGELAKRMGVSTPTVSHIVDALDKQGLIARLPDPHDRRICRLTTSDAGAELLEELSRRTTGILADRIHQLSPAQQSAIEAALPALEALAAAPD
ncbi:MAG TPA: MarR family transcriptional regulator [Actinoallomurus sp.]|nr:MarR family transcriptional regulator [Actinoallomurus sp.]